MVVLTPQEKADIIQDIVCDYYDLTVEELHLKTRRRVIVRARQIMHYLVKRHTILALREIGEMSKDKENYKDHATVLHSVKTVTNDSSHDSLLRRELEDMDKVIVRKIRPRHSKNMLDFRMKLLKLIRLSKNEEILRCEVMNLL